MEWASFTTGPHHAITDRQHYQQSCEKLTTPYDSVSRRTFSSNNCTYTCFLGSFFLLFIDACRHLCHSIAFQLGWCLDFDWATLILFFFSHSVPELLVWLDFCPLAWSHNALQNTLCREVRDYSSLGCRTRWWLHLHNDEVFEVWGVWADLLGLFFFLPNLVLCIAKHLHCGLNLPKDTDSEVMWFVQKPT